MRVFLLRMRALSGFLGLVVLAACGSATTVETVYPTKFTALFQPGPMVHAVEAEFALLGVETVKSASFVVHTKPGNRSADVHVSYARSYLERYGAIDRAAGVLRFPVFGLYEGYDNRVSICLDLANGTSLEDTFTVTTGPRPEFPERPPFTVDAVDPALDVSFVLLQADGGPMVYDMDGETRWACPTVVDGLFGRLRTQDGFIVGSNTAPALYQFDWLGRSQRSTLADPRITRSLAAITPGKTGFLDTVFLFEDGLNRDFSVLIETTETGATLQEWDFDKIFENTILAGGEDPSSFVKRGENWFHLNSAVYDKSDDSVIVSSRHHFVAKVDHGTGAIKWILGNPEKNWYANFPASLQPLALHVIGDPPIGQHALSLSADGQYLMLFNNGAGSFDPEDAQDSRTYSKASVYRIDAEARTAEEVWTYDNDESVFSPVCSSAWRTAQGNMMVLYSSPQGGNPRILIVNEAEKVLFDAHWVGPMCRSAWAAEEIPLESLLLE